jgi:diguanylate cyclase
MVSLKASLEAWDQVDALLRKSFAAYAEALSQFEEHVGRAAAGKFQLAGLDFEPQRAALTRADLSPADALPVLESVGRAVQVQLRAFGQRLCQSACSAQDLRDVVDALNGAIRTFLETGSMHEAAMRGVASRLQKASESDNVTMLRILVRHQSAELTRLADEAQRHSQAVADQLSQQVRDLSKGLATAHDEARHDSLTGLFNRRALEELFRSCEGQSTPRCLILLDIDRFKSVNDQYGYLAGDELLRQVAARIQAVLAPPAMAARWGGDEFIVLLDGGLPAGMNVARQLNQKLCGRYHLDDRKASHVLVQASVGLSEWRAGESAETVLQRADVALKARKRPPQDNLPNVIQ